MNKEALELRKQGLLVTLRQLEDEAHMYRGAVAEIDYWIKELEDVGVPE